MRSILFPAAVLSATALPLLPSPAGADELFEKPVMLKADGQPIRTDAPGYASPCLADIDGDGRDDLLVGQFQQGYIRYYPAADGFEFRSGSILEADDRPAEVPGVW